MATKTRQKAATHPGKSARGTTAPPTSRGSLPSLLGRVPWLIVGPLLAGGLIVAFLAVRTMGSGTPANGAYVGQDLHALVVDPRDPTHIFVGGHASAATSRDGGKTFTQIPDLQGNDDMSWSLSPDGRQQVVSGHYGLRVSSDGGQSWIDRTGRLPDTDTHAVGVDPDSPTHLVAYIVGRGVFRSLDSGQTWQSVGGKELSLMGPILVTNHGATLLASDMQGVVRSSDGGQTWSVISTQQFAWLTLDPGNPLHLLGSGNGVMESQDGGGSWQPVANTPGGAVTVAISASPTPRWYAGALNGDQAVVFSSTDNGRTWQLVSTSS